MGWTQFVAVGVCLFISGRACQARDPVISEFAAVNQGAIADEDADNSDWVEIFNPGDQPAQLAGWSLTDVVSMPHKWRFPDVELAPRRFLIVFLSGKDRRGPDGPLHANFKLSRSGEYLGLVRPDGRHSGSSRLFPPQVGHATYGFAMASQTSTLVAANASARYLVPENVRAMPPDWKTAEFDDSAWAKGTTGLGYDTKPKPTYTDLIQTDTRERMQDKNATLLVRLPLPPLPPLASGLRLRVKYDSGLAVFVNGVEVVRKNVGFVSRFNSRAIEPRDPADVLRWDEFTIALDKIAWRESGNVLAIHAANDKADSPDFLILPELDYITVDDVDLGNIGYHEHPSPGVPNNADVLSSFAPRPNLVTPGRAFAGSVQVEFAPPPTGGRIVYTLDGSMPTTDSTPYETSFALQETTRLRARLYFDGLIPSDIVDAGYVAVSPEVLNFSSNLPVFVISAFGRTIRGVEFTDMHMEVFTPGADGRTRVTGERDFGGPGGIKVRGSSTEGRAKKAYSLEVHDEFGTDLDVGILGLPPESDWILYAAYNFDRALLRNPFVYELSNQIGRYAVRTRFCEVFVHTGGPEVTRSHYVGVYCFMEKITRSAGRVNITPVTPTDVNEPEVTGGYILKIDRPDPGDIGFRAGGQEMRYVEPKETEITPAQATWLKGYFDSFAAALNSTDTGQSVESPEERPYGSFIDVDAWIDHHIINDFTKNPDGLTLSTYFHKDRNGKIVMGPVWDFDRTMGSDDDDRSADPVGWMPNRNAGWWSRLFADPAFSKRYAQRWRELRSGPMSTENMHAILDAMAVEIREAQPRNQIRWPLSLGPGGWPGQVNRLKEWAKVRAEWIDSELVESPVFSHPGGPVSRGFAVEVLLLDPDVKIFYTINGGDPRTAGSEIAPDAIEYSGPIVIQSNSQIQARALFSNELWSHLVEASFAVDFDPLVITEIMYDPPEFPEDQHFSSRYEFLEFQNIGTDTIDLSNFTFLHRGRIVFSFASLESPSVPAGGYFLLVRNEEAFRERYGAAAVVLGEYSPSLSNRSGELKLLGREDEPIIQFTYRGDWQPSANGKGHSLVIRDSHAAVESWGAPESWRPSADVGGSPGAPDSANASRQLPGDVNSDGALSVSDAIAILLAMSGEKPAPCDTAAANGRLLDVSGDGSANAGDAIHLLLYLFQRGTSPVLGQGCDAIEGCPPGCP